MRKSIEQEQVDTVVIGAGQSGLASGYRLKEYGHDDFVILEGKERVGDTWRDRWDSLRLFSPARYNGLPGMPFPAAADVYPTKDEMADFLEAYSQRFQLPVRTGVWVERLAKSGSRFEIKAGRQEFKADNIIVAMSSFQCPRVPNFAPELDRDIVQLHSSQYRNPSQLQEGPVLLVGASNSGAEIGLELAS
ncbi:MAG: NAD(P)-binding domain-containing protein, partial [Candidatus Promineifilaceae bacterium]|nr:NAD(P)-binding domain-containing protein [Candidatus Promineifilaceae bacterium]